MGCVFAGVGIGRAGDVFCGAVVGWFFEGDIHPTPRVARTVFGVVSYLYEVERNTPTHYHPLKGKLTWQSLQLLRHVPPLS